MQIFQDRRGILNYLISHHIPVPPSFIVNQGDTVDEYEDYIEINNNKLYKPFIEKSFHPEDHDLCIYFNGDNG